MSSADEDGPVRFFVRQAMEEEDDEYALDRVADDGFEVAVEQVREEPVGAQGVFVELPHREQARRGVPEDERIDLLAIPGFRGVLSGHGRGRGDHNEQGHYPFHAVILSA